MAMNVKKAWARVVDRWQSMTINDIMALVKKLMVLAIICSLVFLYFLNKGEKPKVYTPPEQRDIKLTDEALNRDLDARIEDRVKVALDEYFNKLDERLSEDATSEDSNQGVTVPEDDEMQDADELDFEDTSEVENGGDYPPASGDTQQGDQTPPPPVWVEVGSISRQTFEPINEQVEEDVSVEKFKIPVGFMPAKLLVGVRAQTSQDGAQNPKPVHFRVQAPATLPNKVRMNLSGCFVIANTWGNLATERIEAELKSIHCVSRDKNTLIEGDVFGYLADTDGQRDMHGRVVTKAGALLSRQVAADILGGIGDVAANSAGTTQTSALGTVKTLDGDEMFQAGLASGVSSGFKRTSEFISNLIVQSGPIIESGAAKDVVLMIQKSSEIEVKTLNTGGL
ncbi:TPA: TraB/VirB10 family protein [Vibrio parahaemolyticus]|uniref:TraB/VirB10 family protein n=1 Tax=Vibrio sp. 99K-1 TaxID=2607603 RepID=UPI00149390C4|nr:TraB/VirB10 family protein [Vibrio sp. 99K-1]NOI88278.1 hypothetical protein [Vibrio sp. 99K-1]